LKLLALFLSAISVPDMARRSGRSGGNANAIGARAKKGRSRARKGKAKGGKSRTMAAQRAARGGGGGEGATRPLEFQPRNLKQHRFNKWGFIGYLIFLMLFLSTTVFGRDADVYNFSQRVKAIVATEHFHAIGADTDYFEWLSLHFLPGLTEFSFGKAEDSPFALVGAPRIRQVRAVPCVGGDPSDGWEELVREYGDEEDYHLRKVVPACWENDEETGSTESFGGAGGTAFTYQSAETLGERVHYNGDGGLTYPGGGFVVPVDMMKRLMVGATGRPEEAATVYEPVTEFYGFSYMAFNVSELVDSGWWNARTTAIFHDFTVASSRGTCSCTINVFTMRFLRVAPVFWVH
jgi:hypothetical protein